VENKIKITTSVLKAKKRRGNKITLLTAYDAPMANFIDEAGIDVVLVSDAVGTIGNGKPEAISVTVDEMIYHTKAVRNGVKNSLVVTTLPFGTYTTIDEAIKTATRIMKEGTADAIHLEGTKKENEIIEAIVYSGIPVMGHIGITKQKIVRTGYIRIPGRKANEAMELIKDAAAMEKSGAFAIIVECLPYRLSEIITGALKIPTISIGSGNKCDGQGLVLQDMLGLYKEFTPKFLKVYADISKDIISALTEFRTEVESGKFPGPEHTYNIEDKELEKLIMSLQQN